MSINIYESYRGENLPKRKKEQTTRGILISQNSFTQFFSIQLTKFEYSWLLIKYWKLIDKSQRKLVGIPTKLLILQLLDALNYQTWLLIDSYI